MASKKRVPLEKAVSSLEANMSTPGGLQSGLLVDAISGQVKFLSLTDHMGQSTGLNGLHG